MLYFSTRDTDKKFTFEEIILNGLAEDGGLYIPEQTPIFTENDINRLLCSDYETIAYEIIKQFTGETFTTNLLKRTERSATIILSIRILFLVSIHFRSKKT